jgi:hypothetical protein
LVTPYISQATDLCPDIAPSPSVTLNPLIEVILKFFIFMQLHIFTVTVVFLYVQPEFQGLDLSQGIGRDSINDYGTRVVIDADRFHEVSVGAAVWRLISGSTWNEEGVELKIHPDT